MSAFTLNLADMEFILRQIKISEAHAAGTALTAIWVDVNGNVVTAGTPGAQLAIPDPHVPNGLRTVDGTYNNLVAGRENWGSADQPMPRLLTPGDAENNDGDTIDLNGSQPGGEVTGGSYTGASGNPNNNVVDADPRTISNLVVDMSFNNPAAIVAALTFAGSETIYGTGGDLEVVQGAFADLMAVLNDPLADDATKEAARDVFDAVLETKGISASGGSLSIPNIAPDEGLSAPFNAWMTFFGQFFDHGLDLISKGGNGTVYVPLAADDPLVTHGRDGIAGNGDEVLPQQQFMVLTRATPANGSQINTTTPFVDQNQTYTSNASHQVFLREYALDSSGRPVATGHLLDGQSGNSLPTWADIKAQAQDMLGLTLSDVHVLEVPLLATDPYGMFERGPNGFAQVIVEVVHAGGTTLVKVEGKAGGLDLLNILETDLPAGHGLTGITEIAPLGTRHAFLDDIAHNAVPTGVYDPDGPAGPSGDIPIAADTDTDIGNAIGTDYRGRKVAYDDELLDRHFITGDGRGNENIGLTAVHHVFHSEHNRQVEAQQFTVLMNGDLAFINQWLLTPVTQAQLDALPDTIPTTQAARDAILDDFAWNGERLFQAARFATEMQYQHLVFEEFARKIQPAIDPFVFNNITDVNPAIFAEFANTVYRFGHSMLTDSMPRIILNADGSVNTSDDMGLITSFLNPIAFSNDGSITHDQAAGAIVRGMTIERGNEIDEFIVNALRNNLLGLPLDLAAINIARGRDTNMPSLNEARAQLFGASGSTFLTPYDSWVDFAANIKNPASVINFIAAYGKHQTVLDATTLEGKRAAATALVLGGIGEPEDRLAFLNGTGTWTPEASGLNDIDLWIGGLAEKKMPFGGMLGSTFNAIFELQMENLQDGDRFYYLSRTQGQNLLVSLEQNSFAKLIMANTDMAQPGADGIRGTADDIITRHIGVDSFGNYDFVLEVNAANQADQNGLAAGVDPTGNDAILEALGRGKVQRDDPTTAAIETNFLRFTGGEHVVVGGTNANDTIITDFGDDGIWGDDGDDRIESGAGVDLVNGGGGNDIITDSGDTGDFLKGDEGDDVIANSNGIDILMGGSGQDVIFVGVDDTEVFAGQGNDFVAGGDAVDLLMGNEGDDWIEGGGGFDTIAGDNSELFFDSKIIGHDVMFSGNEEQDFDAESGDDIMVQGESVIRNEGMFGFDWSIYKDVSIAANADLRTPIFTTEQEDILRNRFDKVEALSGWDKDDILRGDDRVFDVVPPGTTVGTAENIFFNDALDQAGLDRISGLDQIVSLRQNTAGAPLTYENGNVILGGKGNDLIQGNGGDDIIDGDAWLNVRIGISAGVNNTATTVDSLRHVFTAQDAGAASWIGKSLFELMLSRTVVPNQLQIVREILDHSSENSFVDTAVFNDVLENYTITRNANGSVTVTQNAVTAGAIDPVTQRALVSDGIDTLWNVEILQFANNVTVDLRNEPATGAPGITGDGATLTATTTGIQDENGVPANAADFTFTWQRSVNGQDPWVNVGTGPTFAPNGNTDFHRVVVTFLDGDGNQETLTSLITARVGTNVANTLPGDPGPNLLNGLDGVDTLAGGAGDDVINGGAGGDILTGNAGADTINGGAGGDNIDGGADNDTLAGGAGADTVSGGAGDDTIVYDNNGGGNDTISGNGGTDTLSIIDSGNNSTLTVNLNGAGVITQINGGGSIATIESVTANLGAGDNDRLTYAGGNVAVDLGAGTATGFTSIAGIENVTTGGGSDALVGNAGVNDLSAGGGVDELRGGGGNDTLDGGAGANDTAVYAGPITNFVLNNTGANITVQDQTGGEGTDTLSNIEVLEIGGTNYTVSNGNGNNNAITTAAGSQVIFGLGGNDTINGGNDSDYINAGAGGDTIIQVGNGGGRDFVDGGANADTYQLNGSAGVEAFQIHTRASAVTNFPGVTFAINTEIVIVRNGVVIAELDNIEEIVVNALNVTANDGNGVPNGGPSGGDTVAIFGDFGGTSLNFSTITINGSSDDETVDISTLTSAHRVVFRSNGGNDTIVGTLRAQDVIELPAGADPNGYDLVDNGDGTKSYVSDAHEIKFSGAAPQLHRSDDDDDDDDEDDDCNDDDDDNNGDNSGNGNGDDDEDEDDEDEDEDDDDGQQPAPNPGSGGTGGSALPFVVYLGTAGGGTGVGGALGDILSGLDGADALFGMGGDDNLVGHGGNDNLVAGDGNDLVFGDDGNDTVLAGAGDDTVFGGNGNDTIWADGGNDRITGGEGSDVIDAGDGNDTIYASLNDGNDVITGGAGIDTIDYQAITAALTINLGAGGSATSTQSGTDTLNGIENVKGGAGNDTIHASTAHNVLDGGLGDDTFVFSSAATADGDRIDGFALGDTIDLTSFMPVPVGGTFVGSSATFNLAGQVKLVFVGEDTRVDGNTDTDGDVDFSILVSGRHLTGNDFA